MRLSFLPPHDPKLTQAAAPIPVDSITAPSTKHHLEQMEAIAYTQQDDGSKPLLVGLSAPQVGIFERIIIVDVAADGHGAVGDLRTYINPIITESSSEQTDWYEGCYSTRPVCGIVSRHHRITIEAYSPEGEPLIEQHEGYVARIFQHEIDHLDGRVFVDRITDDENIHWVETEDFPTYRDKESWRNWPKKYPRSRWQQMRDTNTP